MRNRVVTGKDDRANAAHFRFLGLRRGESDAGTIRSAARAMSGLITDSEGGFGVDGEVRRRSEIALAAYRLLDPRRRNSFFERVQLCYPADRDEQPVATPSFSKREELQSNPWVSRMSKRERSEADLGSGFGKGFSKLMRLPVIERAIQEELSEPATAQAAAVTMSWIEERREVIRSLRDLEPSQERSASTITWIRSVLGW